MHLGKAEICDNKDNNCDGLIDEGVKLVFYKDLDGDGYTDGTTQVGCIAPTGYVLSATPGDCNDNDPNIRTCPPSSSLAGWGYRRAIRISNYSSSSLTDYQVLISNPVYNEDGLVLSFHFNEGSGTVAYDSSGNGNNGNLVNGPTWVDGKFGKALSFDGSDDWVYMSEMKIAPLSYTISAWIFRRGVGSTCCDVIVAKDGRTPGTGSWVIHFSVDPSNRLRLHNYNTNGQSQIFSTNTITLNSWYHVAVIYDASSQTARFCINGNCEAPVSHSPINGRFDQPWVIGTGDPAEKFNGIIDEVRIYNRALSDVEIQALYQAKARLDYGDIRFTDSDGTTQLNYWQEADGKFWVKVPSIPANSTKTIYVYYGNPNATSLSNGDATFDFFDDFESGSLNKWTPLSGTYEISTLSHSGQYAARKTSFYYGAMRNNIILGTGQEYQSWFFVETSVGDFHHVFQYVDDNNYYYVNYLPAGTDNPIFEIGKKVAGVSTTLASKSPTLGYNQWLKIIVKKTSTGTIEALVTNGLSVDSLSASDTSLTSPGYLVLGGWHQVRFDDIRVRKYTSPEPAISLGAEEVLSGGGSAPYIREKSSLGDVEEKQTRYGCSSADIVFYVLYLIFPAFILFALLKRRFFVRN
jgi:hypothetical protein